MLTSPTRLRSALGRRKSRSVARRRKLLQFEQLENRLLLDSGLSTAVLSSAQRQSLISGLDDMAAWTDTLSSYNRIGQPILIVDKSLGQELAVRSLLYNQLVTPLSNSLVLTTSDVVNAMKLLGGTFSGLTVTVNPTTVDGGLLSTPAGDELQFKLVFDAARNRSTPVNLGSNVQNAGLNLDPSTVVNLHSDLHFDFTFGIDLTPGINASEAFFVRVNSLTMSESIHETNLSTPAKVGLLGAQVQGGTLDLNGTVAVTLINPDADAKGNITLAELKNTNISAIAVVSTTANSLSGSLPLVATLGATTFAGSPTATISSTNVFSGPAADITGNAGFSEMQYFNNISAGNLLTVLDRVASGLQGLAPTLDVNTKFGGLPYVHTQPSAVVDFNALAGRVSRGLYDPVLTAYSPFHLVIGGRLSDDAIFSLRINDSVTTAVVLHSASQQVGENIATFFNRSLPPTLVGKISASQNNTPQGSFLALKATDPAITELEILISNRSNSITFDLGFQPGQFSSPAFKFDTVQAFVPVLAQLMGLSTAQVNPQYDPATHALSFQTSFQGMNFSRTVPFDFSSGLGPLTYLSPSSGTFTSTPTASARVGLELAGLQTVLTATSDAPTTGVLASTAHFSVTLNGTSPVTIVVGRDTTNGNLNDLVADVNSSLRFSGLGGLVTAGRNGNRITLTSATGSTLHVDAAASDTAATQLFLRGDGIGARWGQNVFLASGAQLTINSQVIDPNISGAAALGIQPLTIGSGSATIGLNASATLTAQTRIGELRSNASSVMSIAPPTITLVGHFVLNAEPALGVSAANPAVFDLALPTSKLATVLTASIDGPMNGQLGGDAHFSLTLGEGAPVPVTVPSDMSNASLDDLIADINTAISTTQLRGSVVAGRSGNLITLSASGFDSLAINSAASDPTQTSLHLANAAAAPAIGFNLNTVFRDKLASLRTFGTDDFVSSVKGIRDLFLDGKLNALTAKIPMLNQSVDDVLGISQKLTNSVETLLGKTGTNLKIATQGSLLTSFKSALAGLQLSLPNGSTDDLFAIYDALRGAAQNAGRTDVPHAADLASTIVASITPVTQAIARLTRPSVDLVPMNNVLNLLKQATPALPDLGTALAEILQLGAAGTVTTQIVNANPSGSELSLVVHVNWLPTNITRGIQLSTLKIPNIGPLKFASGSFINLTVSGDLKFDFGFNTVTDMPFLVDTSHFNATSTFGTAKASYDAIIGGVSVTLGHAGNPIPAAGDPPNPVSFQLLHDATNPPAMLVTTVTPSTNPLGFIPFSSAASNLVYGSTSGHLHAKLPVYVTGNSRGDILVDWDFPKPTVSAPTVTPPGNLTPTLQAIPYNFQILKDGILDWTEQFKNLLSNEVLGNVPLIHAGADVSGGFISLLNNQFYNAVSRAISDNGGGDSNQFRQNLNDYIKTALGSYLVIDSLKISPPDKPSPEIRFKIHGLDMVKAGFRIGLNGLGLDVFDVTAKPVDVSLNYDLNLGFGISKTEGFYFIVEPVAPQFTLNVGAVLDPSAKVSTELFSLPVAAHGNVGAGMQKLTRVDNLGLNITVLDPDGHMTSEQLDPQEFPKTFSTLVGASGADAHIDLHLRANGLDPRHPDTTLPGISTDLLVDQHFSPGRALTDGEVPRVKLDNIGLDAGSALSKIVQPILKDLNSFLAPIRPVVKALDETVPVLSRFSSGRATWLDLIKIYEPDQADEVDNAKKLISILNAIDSLTQKASALSSSTTLINFGYYEFNSNYDLRKGDPGAPKPFDPSNPRVGTFHPSFGATNDGKISQAVLNMVGSGIGSFLTTDLQDRGVHFPIFEDPSNALPLLFGGDATLITWQLPEFHLDADVYDQYLGTYPVGPIPVSVYLGLNLGVSFNVGIGFDTRGLKADHSFEDGFFFIDVGQSGPPVIEFSAGLSITGAAGIPYIGEAGVRGTVSADILAHWKDDDRDGKVHLDELLANLDQGPECVFDITGRLSFQLKLYAEVAGVSLKLPVTPKITLFEFTNSCPPLPPPELAHISNGSDLDYSGNAIPAGTLVLHIGPYAKLRQPDVSKDNDERLHVYEFDPGVITVSGFGQSKKYGDAASPIHYVYGDAGMGDNTLLFDSTVMADTMLLGGRGNDTIRGGSGHNYIIGRGGNDTLIGGVNDDHIESGAGDAKIYGLAGKDSIYADGGNNYIDGGDDADEIHGGVGSDIIYGGTGNDSLYGGGGTDQIFGERGDDVIFAQGNAGVYIEGGPGNNLITGSDGADMIYADAPNAPLGQAGRNIVLALGGDDRVYGGIDNFTEVHGGAGNDLIYGGSVGDWLFGDADNDTIYGGAGNDIIHAGSGGDLIYGEAGDDLIFADSGYNTIYGGIGSDTIFGSSGSVRPVNWPSPMPFGFNTDFAGEGNDKIYGEAGIDFIYGGVGTTYIDGGTFNDFIYGGTGSAIIHGGSGDDYLRTGDGDEQIFGDAGDDLLEQTVAANQKLTDNSLTGRGNDTLIGIERVQLVDLSASGGFTFDVGGWTAAATLVGSAAGNDTVAAITDADFALSDGNLKTSLGGSFLLKNITRAYLAGVSLDNIMEVSLWTGTGTLVGGSGLDRVVSVNDANFVLIATSLTRSTGGSFTLIGIQRITLGGGPASNTINASGFLGNAWLYGGAGDDVLTGGSGDDYLDGGTGTNILDGGAGNDVLVAINSTSATLTGGVGDDLIYGSDGPDMIYAGAGRDRVYARGGNDFVSGGEGDDILDGGLGDDTIWGDAGADLLVGGVDSDTLYAFNPSGVGDDGAINYLYGDFGTSGNEAGTGNDIIVGGTGNDQLFGEGGTNSISGGGPGRLVSNGPAVGLPSSSPIPAPPIPVPPNWPPALPGQSATLPSGVDYRGRWTEYAGSASGGGLSNSPAAAIEPSIAVGTAGQFVAWSDLRTGTSQIYVALHTGLGWQELADSAHAGGISAADSPARRPSVALDAGGLPMVAWTQFNGSSSDIYVARYDAFANSGLGGWVAIGGSLVGGGISGTGRADQAHIVMTSTGPVVAWRDSSTGVNNVYVRRFENVAWVPLGTGAASGSGVSASATHVSDLSLVSDGSNVAVAWSQNVGGRTQIYQREFAGTAWNGLGASTSGNGLSGTTGNASSASLAYFGGTLFATWQDNTSGHNEVYAAKFDVNANNWVEAGDRSKMAGGISNTHGDATRPQLAANSGRLFVIWADNRLSNSTGNTTGVYVKNWNGLSFVEGLPGDASYRGIGNMIGTAQTPALSVDGAGHPFVAWSDTVSGKSEIYVRGSTFDVGTVHYVNDGDVFSDDVAGNSFTTAAGSDSFDGLSPATPKGSLQGVLNDSVHHLSPGDVIVVDAGTYRDTTFFNSSANGVLVLGSPNEPAIQNGLMLLSNTANLTFNHLTLTSGVVSTADANLTISDNVIQGLGVQLRGGSAAQVVHNLDTPGAYGVILTASVQNPVIERNTIRAGFSDVLVTGSGASGIVVRDNRLGGSGRGILLSAPASGRISGNRIDASTLGLSLTSPFSGLIEDNDISRALLGVSYNIATLLSGNRIHDNATGIASTINDTSGGLGYFGITRPNQIYKNAVGVNLQQAVMQNQHVFANGTGVSGSGSLVPSDFEHANVIEMNTTGVDISGPVQFNRIDRNSVGIKPRSGQLIAHDLFYRNAVGINVQGLNDVRIFNNTMVTPTGDNIRIGGSSSQVEVRNNILWTGSGYDIYVDNNSTVGFFSDYNDLHASGTGKLVFWTKDFTDILDWQEDVHQFDLHSIGRTIVNPDWSQPRFISLALDDYRVFDETARQRFSSPTIDLGDARADQAFPTSYQNLLTNGGFESGLIGWTASPSGAIQSTFPSPWQGIQYFFASTNQVTTLDQRVDLIAAGALPADIDSKNISLVFGGRARSANETPVDTGVITLTFYDVNNVVLKTVTTLSSNVNDRWELIGDRTFIPAGARSVNFRYTAVRRSGTTNDAYLDGAFLYVQADTLQPNLGADGNTYVENSQNVNQHLVLRSPDLYTDWLRDAPLKIRWDSLGNTANAPVRIDLYQDGPNGPQLLLNIAPSAPDTGEYTWIASNSGINFGTYGLRIRISIVGNETISDRSTETFTVPENTQSLHTFYVNNASTVNDEYSSAAGNNRNTGLLPDRPKPYVNNVLRIYTLGPNDTLYVDTGDYPELYPTVISPISGFGDDAGFGLTGPISPNRIASFSPANPFRLSPILELNDADFLTISHLTLFGGTMGLWAHDGTTNLTASYLTIRDNAQEGIRIDPHSVTYGIRIDNGPALSELGYSTLVHNGFGGLYNRQSGIYIDGLVGRIHHTSVTYSSDRGIALIKPGAARIEANTVAHNGGNGLSIDNSGMPTATIGNADLTLGLGNIIDDNYRIGILAIDSARIVGNNVSNTREAYSFGILAGGNGYLSGVEVVANTVHDNFYGISGASSAHNNRVYHNAGTGIQNTTQVYENVVYSNSVGIDTYLGLHNNLIYANTSQGIYIHNPGYASLNVDVVSNTVYQSLGNAIVVERGTPNVHLRNNTLWAQGGYDISVDSTSQQGFTSDFNILRTSGTGNVAWWQGVTRPTLSAWQNTTFQDFNSIGQDPLFVSPMGADGKLGYFTAANDGRDDDFHEQSLNGSFHGGSLAPIVGASGLPVFPNATLTVDANQSPAIDRGALSDSYANEPTPNGNFINIGAFGNTVHASLSPAAYVLVTKADGGETWPQGHTFDITWRSQNTAATVKIELLDLGGEDQLGNPTVSLVIANNAPNTGSYSWSIPTTLTVGSNYRIRVTRNDNTALTDTSNSTFTIAAPINVYYVNDGSVNSTGDWTTVSGDNSLDGLSPGSPKASIGGVLAAYHLNSGDIIRVDDGTYPLGVNIVLTALMSGITIEGYHDTAFPLRHTLLDRGNVSYGSAAFELGNASNVTLDHLWITGAYSGVYAPTNAGSTGLTVSTSTLFGNSNVGIQLLGGNNKATLAGNTIFGIRDGVYNNQQGTGIQADGSDIVISQNTIYDAVNTGIQALGDRANVSNNHVFSSGTGISVTNGGGYSQSFTPTLRSFVRDNVVHDNSGGIIASGTTVVSGNRVYGHQDVFGSARGIMTSDYVEAFNNTVYQNNVGILGGGSIHDNRIYGNLTGIQTFGANSSNTSFGFGTTFNNTVYSNQIGIESYGIFSSSGSDTIRNNLVYANSSVGIYLHGYHLYATTDVANNTVYQTQGDAIRVADNFSNAHLRNNILWAQGGNDIAVDASSEVGFQSDYNNLYTSGSGKIGLWEGRSFTRLVDWSYELGVDRHSLSIDPQFVNPAGADGVLGYSKTAIGTAQILNDKAPGFSVTGSWDRVDQADSGGKFLESVPSSSSNTARWDFGPYPVKGGETFDWLVSAYWSANRGLGSVTYSVSGTYELRWVFNGVSNQGTFGIGGSFFNVNQQGSLPSDHQLGTSTFNVPNPPHDLGTLVKGTLSVTYTVSGGQNIVADALTLNGQSQNPIPTQGIWIQGGLLGDYYRRATGGREEAASWTVTGLTPGAFYEVSSTWLAYSTLSNRARYFIYDGDRVERQIAVDQTVTPGDFLDNAAVGWKRLAIVQATGTTMTVKLSAQSNDAVIADAIRFQQVRGNTALDDDFHVMPTSSSVDHGNPVDFSFAELSPNGDRVDQGAYGNTPQAASSPSQIVQVLSPSGLEKLQVGQQIPITWRSAGLTQQRPVALVNAGGSVAVDNWGVDNLRIQSGNLNYTPTPITQAINTSGVAHPAPQAVYQNFAEAPYSTSTVTGSMSYQLSVPDGTYAVRLHFVEPNSNAAYYTNFRRFDVQLQGNTVLAGYNVAADAGGAFKATEKNFIVTAAGGGGISLNLVSLVGIFNVGAIISGIEVLADNSAGVAAPTFNLELSGDSGANWMPLAAGLSVDQYGRGNYPWTIPANLPPGSQYLVRVKANDGLQPQGVSDQPFQITNAGHDYYVNDNSTIGDFFTTAVGDNTNSGKSPVAPMASLQALLNAYSLGAGDVVHVDTGTYNLVQNIVLGPQHSGVRIEGPSTGVALLNRGNTSASNYSLYAIDVQHATNVTLDHLSITGGYVGINVADGSQSTGLTVSNSVIFGNGNRGLSLGSSNDRATITDNTFYGLPGGSSSLDDQGYSIYVQAANDLQISGNRLSASQNESVHVLGDRTTIANNEVFGGGVGISLVGSGTIRDNIVHNNSSTGISASTSGFNSILVTGNIVYGHLNPQQTGILANGLSVEIRNNVVYDNFDGIYGSKVIDNRIYHNSNIGIRGSGLVQSNLVYSNGVGMRITGNYSSDRTSNNVVYANTTTGILVGPSANFLIANNTVYQPTGDAIRFEGDAGVGTVGLTTDVKLRNNLLWAQAGYDLVVPASAEGGLVSDYNVFYTTGSGKLGNWQGRDFTDTTTWFFETGQDLHSQFANPLLANPAGQDGILGYSTALSADRGTDDDFHVLVGSPVIDRGSPTDAYFSEPSPNGNRIDVGAYGNTSGATSSAAQGVQLLTPEPLQKIQVGQLVPINWQSSGLTLQRPVGLINAGGGAVQNWNADTSFSGLSIASFTDPVDTSGVSDPAPQNVYQSYALSATATSLAYQLQVPDGSYKVRLHFVEPSLSSFVGWRKFDIQLQGTTVQTDFDILATAGARFKAVQRTYTLIATGGSGVKLQLTRNSGFDTPIISGIEILAADTYGVATPTFNLDLSGDNGATWSPLASSQPVDRYGRGSFNWTVPVGQPLGSQYLVRVTSNDGVHPQDVSTRPFLITNNGHDYYVNDNSQTGDVFTTTIGNNLNSGKRPDQPMANLAALLSAYTLGTGDVVHVDTGTYDLVRNIVVTAQNSGVRIQGPSSAIALLRRSVTGGDNHFPIQRFGTLFDLQHSTNVTLDHLSMTDAYAGIYASDGARATGLSVTNSSIYGTGGYGIYLDKTNDFATIAGNLLYGLPGGTGADDQLYGIYVSSNDARITGNKIYDSYTGVSLSFYSLRGLISENEIYGNRYGIESSASASVAADFSLISKNIVHNNTYRGIVANSNNSAGTRVIGNTVYGQSADGAAGITASSEVGGNIVYGNYDGIVGTSQANVHDNRVFNNSHVGLSSGGLVLANRVYSNSIGIQYVNGSYTAAIANNLVYNNTNAGILLDGVLAYTALDVVNNTVYQSVGDAVRVSNGGLNIRLRDNILWVEAGYDINVAASSQSAVTSDYNLLYKGTDLNAHIGFWNNTNQDSLLAWQTATSRDTHSLGSQPQFVDRDGADNNFGVALVNSVFVDGGADDNFYLLARSPGIDSGYSWSYAVDAEQFVRRNDAATDNHGALEYFPALGSSLFATGGTSLSFSLGASTGVYLPFSFPFYDTNYSSVFISPEGYLQLGSDYFSNQGDVNQQFVASSRIAPFWDASLTYRIGDGLFIDTSTAGQVSFRWKATNPTDDSPVNLAVVLFSDGRIRFDYGSGNAGLNPLVGISYGRTRAFQYLSGYNGIANLSNANSVLFTQAAGYTDMGAYEFRGSGLDTTPPTIASTLPTAVGTSADTGGKINAIQLLFSEDVNAIDASATAVYELRKAGLNGFGSADDLVYSLSPQYTPGSSRAMLKINGLNNAGLPVGQYRLTVTSNTNTSVHDLAGLRLDGDADGSEGGNYVRTFSVTPPVADLSVALIVDNPNPFEGMNLQYTVTISDLSGPASVSGVLVNDLLPAGLSFVSATATAGSYDNASGIWTIGGMTLGGSQTLRITAKVPLGLAFRTLTNTATLGFVDQGDTNAVNDSASVNIVVRQSADLALTMDASNSPRQGDLQYYYLTINNSAGPGTATGVQVTDMLPNGLRFVSATPGSGTSYNSATGIWTVGTLTKGASVNLQIVGQVVGAAGQNVTNTASITAAEQFDYKVNNNTASRTLTIFGGTLIPWQNPLNPLDVDDSGDTNPLDVLVLINDLNISGSRQLSAGQNPADPRKYLDVDGDGFASPLDVLVIINFINRRGNGEGESPQLRSLARTKADETVDVLMTDLSWLDVLEKKQTSKCSFSVEGAMTSWSFAKPGG